MYDIVIGIMLGLQIVMLAHQIVTVNIINRIEEILKEDDKW